MAGVASSSIHFEGHHEKKYRNASLSNWLFNINNYA
jgi:hypothetical protein